MARDLKTDELHEAVFHLMRLAACYEGSGDEGEDPIAEAKLVEVVGALEVHRHDYLETAFQRLVVELASQLAGLYRRYNEDTDATKDDLRAQVTSLFRQFSLGLEDEDLESLVVTHEEIIEQRGPTQCAAEVLSKIMGFTWRSVYSWKKPDPPILTPTAFSRHVTDTGLLRYMLTLFGFMKDEADPVIHDWMRRRVGRVAREGTDVP